MMTTQEFAQAVCGMKWSERFNCYMYLPSDYARYYFNIWIDNPLIVDKQYLKTWGNTTYYNGYGDFLLKLR